MRGLSGLTLVLTGGIAGIYGYLPDAAERQAMFERMLGSPPTATVTLREHAGGQMVVADPARRVFSPSTPLFTQLPTPSGVNAATPPVRKPLPVATASVQDATSAAAPVRTAELKLPPAQVATSSIETKSLPAPRAVTKTPSDKEGRELLTRDLQRELSRVGCYDGEINGVWNTASRRAMKAFTERVNATLPLDRPDHILLTLVRGHAAEACGAPCPSGQLMSREGRCLPRALVAQAKKVDRKRAKAESRQAAASTQSDRGLEAWSKVTTIREIAQQKDMAVASAGDPRAKQAPAPMPEQAPLPGRMSVGGPAVVQPLQVAAEPPSGSGRIAVAATTADNDVVAAQTGRGGVLEAAGRETARPRIPVREVEVHHLRPQRVRPVRTSRPSYYRPSRPSKSARVRAMHYKLFQDPTRTTN